MLFQRWTMAKKVKDCSCLPSHVHQAVLMFTLLLGRFSLACGETGMVSMLALDCLVRCDDDIVTFEFLCGQVSLGAIIHDRL